MIARVLQLYGRNTVIKDHIRNNNEIIYGARAMNVQLKTGLQRSTKDYDVYSKRPKASARKLEKKLDMKSGGDYYYTKAAMHKGTIKLMDVGFDNRKGTKDDYGIADFSKPERKIKTINVMGIRYAHISERKKDALKSLRDSAFKFRHEKDKADLYRIRKSKEKVTKWDF